MDLFLYNSDPTEFDFRGFWISNWISEFYLLKSIIFINSNISFMNQMTFLSVSPSLSQAEDDSIYFYEFHRTKPFEIVYFLTRLHKSLSLGARTKHLCLFFSYVYIKFCQAVMPQAKSSRKRDKIFL